VADIKSVEARSKNMAAIKSRDTGPELYLRKMLFSKGYRYRLGEKHIPGHPDLWLKKYNTAIFIHGCFWHRHQGCKFAYTPKSRIEFWTKKFERNISRDSEIKRELANKGIRCLVVWECSIKNARKKTGCPDKLLENITAFLHGDALYLEV
jgi:DNA mismatch endonuclease (patch repair protein)